MFHSIVKSQTDAREVYFVDADGECARRLERSTSRSGYFMLTFRKTFFRLK